MHNYSQDFYTEPPTSYLNCPYHGAILCTRLRDSNLRVSPRIHRGRCIVQSPMGIDTLRLPR